MNFTLKIYTGHYLNIKDKDAKHFHKLKKEFVKSVSRMPIKIKKWCHWIEDEEHFLCYCPVYNNLRTYKKYMHIIMQRVYTENRKWEVFVYNGSSKKTFSILFDKSMGNGKKNLWLYIYCLRKVYILIYYIECLNIWIYGTWTYTNVNPAFCKPIKMLEPVTKPKKMLESVTNKPSYAGNQCQTLYFRTVLDFVLFYNILQSF